jgi:hypothetical protein
MHDEIRDELASLRDEVRVLREVLDEIREELSWSNRNAQDLPEGTGAVSAFRRTTSMSADPTARDFRINDVPEATVDRLRQELIEEASPQPRRQSTLF